MENRSLSLNELVDNFEPLSSIQSTNSIQSGGHIRGGIITDQMIESQAHLADFNEGNTSMTVQSGGECGCQKSNSSVQFEDRKNNSHNSIQFGGKQSLATEQLFNSFLESNSSIQSVQSGGAASVNTEQLFNSFLESNPSIQSVQSGGNSSSIINSQLDSDLISTNTIDIFQNFVKNYNISSDSTVQTGGGESHRVISVHEAVDLIKNNLNALNE